MRKDSLVTVNLKIPTGKDGKQIPQEGWSHEERIRGVLDLINTECGEDYRYEELGIPYGSESRYEAMWASIAMLCGAISGGRFREHLRWVGHEDVFKAMNIVKNFGPHIVKFEQSP